MIRLALCLGTLLAAAPTPAATYRVGVAIGHNTGVSGRAPLSFAELDAGKFARVLTEAGGVRPRDLFVLQGRGADEVEKALRALVPHVKQLRRGLDDRVIVIFYYAGHSDGEHLEFGDQRLSVAAVRERLDETTAEVRLVIVDACHSGRAITRGADPIPPFAIHLQDNFDTRGEVILASSAADELALESKEIRGGIFTHHLVSGMRGAADASGDGQITLGEVYGYAYERTVSSSGRTLVGPHHPVFDMRLSGRGELVVARLETGAARLRIHGPMQRALVVDRRRDVVVAELKGADRRTLIVASGAYGVRVWRQGAIFGDRVTVADQDVTLDTLKLPKLHGAALADPRGTARLTDLAFQGQPLRSPSLWPGITIGATGAVGVDVSLWARAELAYGTPHQAVLSATSRAGTGQGVVEYSVEGRIGYRFAPRIGDLELGIGAEAGGGFTGQAVGDSHPTSWIAVGGPVLHIAYSLQPSLALRLQAEALANVLRIDGQIEPRFMPAIGLGVAF